MARERNSERMRFSVADDGYGFDTARCPNSVEGHFGLLGIRKCVQYFNGPFTLSYGSGCGTKAVVTLKMLLRKSRF